MASAAEEAQLASDLLESLDDLYDRLLTVGQLARFLMASMIALRGTTLEPVVAAAAEALGEIRAAPMTENEMNTAALIATEELRRSVGAWPS